MVGALCKMRSIWAFFVLICCTVAVKEKTEEYAALLSDRLIQEISKRLSEMGTEDDSDTCQFTTQKNTIIRTHDSLDAGATFIKSPMASTVGECQDHCCQIDRCSLAVFKEQDDHACYLFDCGHPNHCNFTTHEGFSSMTVIKRPEKHANDLEQLAQNAKTTTTVATTTTTRATTTTTYKPKETSPIYGTCDEDRDCADSLTECLAGYCICVEGYHAQDGVCQKSEQGKPDKDEVEKPTVPSKDVQPQPENTPVPSSGSKTRPPSYDGAKPTEKIKDTSTDKTPDTKPSVGSDEGNSPNIADSPAGSSSTAAPSSTPGSTESTIEKNNPNAGVPNNAMKTAVVHQQNSEVNSAEKDRNSFLGPSNRGAVIALSLGLGITAMLLIFVGCRLRNVKRRLRKGRPLNSNEADYLINGMYL